jgi:hypothetical protein
VRFRTSGSGLKRKRKNAFHGMLQKAGRLGVSDRKKSARSVLNFNGTVIGFYTVNRFGVLNIKLRFILPLLGIITEPA